MTTESATAVATGCLRRRAMVRCRLRAPDGNVDLVDNGMVSPGSMRWLVSGRASRAELRATGRHVPPCCPFVPNRCRRPRRSVRLRRIPGLLPYGKRIRWPSVHLPERLVPPQPGPPRLATGSGGRGTGGQRHRHLDHGVGAVHIWGDMCRPAGVAGVLQGDLPGELRAVAGRPLAPTPDRHRSAQHPLRRYVPLRPIHQDSLLTALSSKWINDIIAELSDAPHDIRCERTSPGQTRRTE
ncbi:hypothetical protein C8E86_0298 [Catellatospora citrea]|nr:hypothetical protein C8E86_0298 [Catellatospora citrea]